MVEYPKSWHEIYSLRQRVNELEAERVSDGLAGQAALDEANNRVRELENQKEYEQRRNAISYKCFICGGALDSYSKCAACYDAKGAECDRLRAEKAELVELHQIQYSGVYADYQLLLATINERASAKLVEVNNEIADLRAENERLRERLAYLPADWTTDSSLETWFPLTAEELVRLKADNERLREALKDFMRCLHDDNGISFPTRSMFDNAKKALGGGE